MGATVFAHLTRCLLAVGSRRAAVQALAAAGLSTLGPQGRREVADARTRCRRGKVRTFAGPPKRVKITFRARHGLNEILVTKSENADTVVPPFPVGTTDPVVVTATKIDQSQRARLEIRTTDTRNVARFCSDSF